MDVFALIVLLLFGVAGFLAIFFTTFGTLLILIGAFIYAVLTGFSIITVRTFVIIILLYFCGELMEYICLIVGAKRFGASNTAVVGALVGAFVGAFLGVSVLGVGIFLGTFLGIFLGAFTAELLLQRDVVKSLKAGTGSVIGRSVSIAAKILIALTIFTIIGYQIWNQYIF